jgi:hypothetical protein
MSTDDGAPGRPARRPHRELIFTLTPVILAVLVLVAVVTVIRSNKQPAPAPAAAPVSLQNLATLGRSTSSTTPPTTAPTTQPLSPAALTAAVDAVDATDTSTVHFGVAILNRATGQETLGAEGSTQFYCASVLKLFVVTDLLHEQEIGALKLTSQDMNYVTRALELSDDNAMDALWEIFGGPKAVTQMIALAHLQDTKLPSDLSQWGETLISPRDVLSVYEYVFSSLDPTDRDLVVGDLNHAAPDGADGFDQSFGLLGPTRTGNTKAKQGWMEFKSMIMLHTTGVLDSHNEYIVALLSRQPESSGYPAGRAHVDAATAAMLTALGPTAVQ